MKLRHFPSGEVIEIDATVDNLYEKLTVAFLFQHILIQGINFKFVSNSSHHAACGYPPPFSDEDEPAHFNPPFYVII